MVQKPEYVATKGFVMFVINTINQLVFSQAPESFNQVKIRGVGRQIPTD